MSAPGVPDGWIDEEREELRFGVWRFYRIVDPEGRSSVREDNLAVRDGVPMRGEDSMRVYLEDLDPWTDPQRVPAATVAAHLGHWLIRGDSRQSSRIRVVAGAEDVRGDYPQAAALVEPPAVRVHAGRAEVTAWYERDGYLQPLAVEMQAGGPVEVRRGDIVTRPAVR